MNEAGIVKGDHLPDSNGQAHKNGEQGHGEEAEETRPSGFVHCEKTGNLNAIAVEAENHESCWGTIR